MFTPEAVFWLWVCPGHVYTIEEIACSDMVYNLAYYTGHDASTFPWKTRSCGEGNFTLKPPQTCSYLRFEYQCIRSDNCGGQHVFTVEPYTLAEVSWVDVSVGLPLQFQIANLHSVFSPICRILPTSTVEQSSSCVHDLAENLKIYDVISCENGLHNSSSYLGVESINYTVVVQDFECFNDLNCNLYNRQPIELGRSISMTPDTNVTRIVSIMIDTVQAGEFVTGFWLANFEPAEDAFLRISGSTLTGL